MSDGIVLELVPAAFRRLDYNLDQAGFERVVTFFDDAVFLFIESVSALGSKV